MRWATYNRRDSDTLPGDFKGRLRGDDVGSRSSALRMMKDAQRPNRPSRSQTTASLMAGA
jgi:hypothetical protein